MTYHGETGYAGKTNFAETACYMGCIALLLAFLGIIAGWKSSSDVRFFTATALVALLIACGTPLAAAPYFLIPGFSQTGSPARVLLIWALSVSVLAGWGCDAVLERKAKILGPALLYVAVGVGLTAYTNFALSRMLGSAGGILSGASNDIRVAAALSFAAIAVLIGHEQKRLTTNATATLIIVLVGVDLIAAGIGYNHAVAPEEVYPRTPLVTWLISHNLQERVMPENRGWAIAAAPLAILPPNSGSVYGLPEAQGYDSLQTAQYKSFLKQLDRGDDPSPAANGNIDFAWGLPSDETRFAGLRYLVFPKVEPGLWAPAYAGPDGAFT